VLQESAVETLLSTEDNLILYGYLFYPTDRLPDAVRWLAWLNPVTWQVDLLRHATYGAGAGPAIRLEAVALILFLLGVFVPANRALNSPIE
jgi:ABC-type polysaccharide/polyol phosphate export permease